MADLVRLSGRFKGYSEGWSDSAVRRYARDAGHLLGQLNELVRCDCTTRNKVRITMLHREIDELERRIRELADEDRRAAERPGLDGNAVMQQLGVGPGRDVGDALTFLLDLKRREGDLPRDELSRRLDAWWAARPSSRRDALTGPAKRRSASEPARVCDDIRPRAARTQPERCARA